MYSVHIEGKSAVAERFIRTLPLFRMGIFRAAHGRGGGKKAPPPSLKSVTDILQ